MIIASLIRELSRKGTSVIDSNRCINKTVSCSGNSDVEYAIEVLKSLEG
jgi:hypothetical protein